jgi:hypothetical protein
MLNFGNKCRDFDSPAASQISIAFASDVKTNLNGDRRKLEGTSRLNDKLRLRFAARQSIDSPMV